MKNQIILNIKDESKLSMFLEWLNQFDFVDVYNKTEKKNKAKKHNFFASAGLWENRDINADDLRKKAWDRNK